MRAFTNNDRSALLKQCRNAPDDHRLAIGRVSWDALAATNELQFYTRDARRRRALTWEKLEALIAAQRQAWEDLTAFLRDIGYGHLLEPAPKQTPPTRRETSLRLRFAILKRDGFCCQLCGVTAQDGARLEVDHKHARSKGGANDPSNLWTLCFACNRGKRTDDL